MPIHSYRPPFDRMRGTIMGVGGSGLVVYDSPKAGNVARAWGVPANPQSPNQVTVRDALIAASQAFRNLSTAEADQWNAAAVTHTRLNRLGISYGFSGINLYCELNTLRVIAGLATTDTPPTKFTLPVIAAASITAHVATAPDDHLTVGVTSSLDPGTDDFHALVLCSIPWTRPARQPRRNDYSMRDHVTPANNFITITDAAAHSCVMFNSDVPVTTAAVIQVRVTPISADWVPGPVEIYTTKTIAAP